MATTYFRTDGWVKTTLGPAVPGAQIYVCNQPATAPTSGTPSPLASIFSDPNGTVPISQPVITDGFGHYDFYVQTGIYTVLVYNAGVLQQVYPDQSVAVVGSSSSISSPNDSIQYNVGGVLNGFAQFLFIPSTGVISIGPSTTTYINPSAPTPVFSPTLQISAGNPLQFMPNQVDQQWAGIAYTSIFKDFPAPTGAATTGFEVPLYINKTYSPSIDPSFPFLYCAKFETFTDPTYLGNSGNSFLSPLALINNINSGALFGQVYGLLVQNDSSIPSSGTVNIGEFTGIFISSLLGNNLSLATYNVTKATGIDIIPPGFNNAQSGSITLNCGISIESPSLGTGTSSITQHEGIHIASQVNGNPGGRNANAWAIHEDDPLDRNAFGSINLGGDTGPLISTGNGSPDGVITSIIGGLYLRQDGDKTTALYVKGSGVGNTTWYPVSTSVLDVVATVNLTGQSAGIGPASLLYAVPSTAAGLYRVSFYSKITTAGTGSVQILGGNSGLQVSWIDKTDNVSLEASIMNSMGTDLTTNTTTTVEAGSVVIDAAASTNIAFSYDYLSSGNTMVYKLVIRAEYLG